MIPANETKRKNPLSAECRAAIWSAAVERRRIREEINRSLTDDALADIYEVSESTVHRVLAGKSVRSVSMGIRCALLSAQERRSSLLAEVRDMYSNDALAALYGVSANSVRRVIEAERKRRGR
jgi:transposase